MADIVQAVLERASDDRPAVIGPTRTTTYREFGELLHRVAGGLRRTLNPNGACLVVTHPGLEESVALTLAGWSLGRRVAVLPPYLKPKELSHALAACGPVVMVSGTTDDTDDTLSFDRLLDGQPGPLGDGLPGAWMESFVSGTTGYPSCVERTATRVSADVENLARAAALVANDRVTTTTTALSTTSVLPALWAGATIVSVPLRSPRQFWTAVADTRVTVISGTPYVYELAARHTPDPKQVESVRLALTTSARLRPSTARALMATTSIPIRNILCSSESGHIAYNDAADSELLATSVGRPLPGVEVQIRDESGSVQPAGKSGRVCVRSPFTAARYRRDPDRTAAVFVDGWVVSADMGFVDGAGALILTGRNDDTIHFGAAKLDPRELEDVLRRHPAVSDVLVVGRDHGRLGQIPVAQVVAADPTSPVDAAELLAHCRSQLSAGKLPQRVEFVPTLARDHQGRIERPAYVRFTTEPI